MKIQILSMISMILFSAPSANSKLPLTLSSSPNKAHLVELFSTQSCSSCPAAQKWISSLKGKKQLWKSFVPIVLHVDYWDYLGWKDPYSSAEFTKRQKHYASIWKSDSVYTPMFVLDGKEWRDRKASSLLKEGKAVGVLSVTRKYPDQFEVRFEPTSYKGKSIRFFGAAVKNNVTTSVNSGENRGKKLEHDFLTVEFNKAEAKRSQVGKNNIFTASIKLGPKSKTTDHFVFWAANPATEEPIQAVGGQFKGVIN